MLEQIQDLVKQGNYLVKFHVALYALMKEFIPTCPNGQLMIWDTTNFEYEEEGIKVEVSNIPAWICPDTGEVSFPSGTTQKLIESVRQLIAITKQTRAEDVLLYEYRIKAV